MKHDRISKTNVMDIIHLNEVQKGILYQYIYYPENGAYLNRIHLMLGGRPDTVLCIEAWKCVMNKSPVLHSVFRWLDLKEPVQIILKDMDPEIKLVDLTHLSGEDGVNNFIRDYEDSIHIDIATRPYEIIIFKLSDNDCALTLISHHILLDGWSTGMVINDFVTFYRNLSRQESIDLQPKYHKYILSSADRTDVEYWKSYLRDYPHQPFLSDASHPEYEDHGKKYRRMSWRYDNMDSLKKYGAAPYYLAWACVLHRHLRQKRIVFGAAISGKGPDSGIELDVAGCFSKVLPVCVDLDYQKLVESLLEELREDLVLGSHHGSVGMLEIREAMQELDRLELFNSCVIVENYPVNQAMMDVHDDIYIKEFSFEETVDFELALQICPFNRSIYLHYDQNRYTEAFIHRVRTEYSNVLVDIIQRPKKRLREVALLVEMGNDWEEDVDTTKLLYQKLERLSEEKRAALLQKLTESQFSLQGFPIEKANRGENRFLLTGAQKNIWIANRSMNDDTSFHVSALFKLTGFVNVECLQKSVVFALNQHEAFFLRFDAQEDGTPYQYLDKEYVDVGEVIDLTGMDIEHGMAAVLKQTDGLVKRKFDLSADGLVRINIYTLDEQTHYVAFCAHHIISDGWSLSILFKEIFEQYHRQLHHASDAIEKTEFDYIDYIVWQNHWLYRAFEERNLSYWKEQLSGYPCIASYPLAISKLKRTNSGKLHFFEFGGDIYRNLEKQSRDTFSATISTIMFAAYFIVMRQFTDQEKQVITTTYAGRNRMEFDQVIGYFVNMLPIAAAVNSGETCVEFVHKLQSICSEAYDHSDIPFENIVDALVPTREIGISPYLQTVFIFQNDNQIPLTSSDFTYEGKRIDNQRTQHSILLEVTEKDNKLKGIIEYSTELFEEAVILEFSRRYEEVLQDIISYPERTIGEIYSPNPKLAEEEWHDDKKSCYKDTLQDLYCQAGERFGDSIACVFGDSDISYREFDGMVQKFRHVLLEVKDRYIGVHLERSVGSMAAFWSILLSGKTYFPMDKKQTPNRLRMMLEEVGTHTVITDEPELSLFRDLSVRTLSPGCGGGQGGKLQLQATDENIPLYLLYTSGSSGQPKGVLGTQKGLLNRLQWMWGQFPFGQQEVCCHKTAIGFVDSIAEMAGGFLQGVPTVIISNEDMENLLRFMQIIENKKITRITLIPSLLHALLKYEEKVKKILSSLTYCFSSGENLLAATANRFLEDLPQTHLINLYGTSEVAADVTFFSVEELVMRSSVPIGRPISNTEIYILNEDRNPVFPGESGEIFVSGESLAVGYLNQPELTDNKFVVLAGQSKKRLYATGDLGRLLPSADIEYLGRIDEQIKVRGIRIELGDIETALLKLPQVIQAAVVKVDEGEFMKLSAYIVSESGETEYFRRELQEQLPEYMIPHFFNIVEEIPLLPNGKVDRRQLASRPQEQVMECTPPRTTKEREIWEIWNSVLSNGDFGITDDFFQLGGNSLKAMEMLLLFNQKYGTNFGLSVMFRSRTVKEMGKLLDTSQNYQEVKGLPHHSLCNDYILSPSQRRIFFLDQLEKNKKIYNIILPMKFQGVLDVQRLESAAKQVIARHESLRTCFIMKGYEPVQIVKDSMAFSIGYEVNSHPMAELIDEFNQPFDLSQAPLLKMKVVKSEENCYFLIVLFHHIICDEATLNLFRKEMWKFYDGGEPEPVAHQYLDYVEWFHDYMRSDAMKKQKAYWMQHFGDGVPEFIIQKDFPEQQLQSFAGGSIQRKLAIDPGRLEKYLSSNADTLFMYLLSCLYVLLNKLTDQEAFAVGVPVSGRIHHDVSQVFGVFINTLVLTGMPSGNKSFRDLLTEVNGETLRALEYQAYPFEELVENLDVPRKMNRNPLFDIMLNVHDNREKHDEMQERSFEVIEFERKVIQFYLTFEVFIHDTGIDFMLHYCKDLFKHETVKRWADYYARIVESSFQNEQTKIRDFEVMAENEIGMLLHDFNDTSRAITAVDRFLYGFRQSCRQPECVAVVFDGKSFTYQYLDSVSDDIAGRLLADGIGRGSIIALMVRRTPMLIAAILGIWKVSAAYLPVDPEYPTDRVKYILDNSNASAILCNSGKTEILAEFQNHVYDIDVDFTDHYEGSFGSMPAPEDLAYMIYTSGSTGLPKGVMLEHGSLDNFIVGISEVIPFSQEDKVLCLTTVSFDIFALEVFLPLAKGATIVLADEEEQLDNRKLCVLMLKNGVNKIQATPSRMQLLLEEPEILPVLQKVTELMIGGEEFPVILLERLKEKYDGSIFNMYGPTETTVWSSVKCLDKTDTITLGRPISNTAFYVLSRELKPCPIGIPGDLYIGGLGVARGYYRNEKLTGQCFINNPCNENEIIYKTGDVVHWNETGELVYHQREDFQVKINGYRIELGEIEYVMASLEGVKSAVVIKRTEDGYSYLCGYIVADRPVSQDEFRQALSRKLPAYMIPRYFMQLDTMPMTPNNKIERLALPYIKNHSSAVTNYELTDTEKEIKRIWNEVLHIEASPDESFFHNGGNSILLMRLHHEINIKYENLIDTADLFGYTTIREIAHLIEKRIEEKRHKELMLAMYFKEGIFYNARVDLSPMRIKTILTEETVRGIQDISQRLSVSSRSIFAGMLLFTLKEYTEERSSVIYFKDISDGKKHLLSFDFYSGEDTGLDGFFRSMENQLSKSSCHYVYPKNESNRAVITLCTGEGRESCESEDGMSFSYTREDDILELAVSFDSGRCNPDIAGEILRNYVAYLSSVE